MILNENMFIINKNLNGLSLDEIKNLKIKLKSNLKKHNTKYYNFKKELNTNFINLIKTNDYNWRLKWFDKAYNFYTNTEYEGINLFQLLLASKIKNFKDNRWLSFDQIQKINEELDDELKLSIIKGSKGTKVEYWMAYDKNNNEIISLNDKDQLIKQENRKENEFKIISKVLTVFNASQINNMPTLNIDEFKKDLDLIKLSNLMNVKIEENTEIDTKYYSNYDIVKIPNQKLFYSNDEYKLTLLYNLLIASFKEKRLNIKLSSFLKENDLEKFILEMVITLIGIDNLNLSNEYINKLKINDKNYLRLLEDNGNLLSLVINESLKIKKYIIGLLNNEFKKDLILNLKKDEIILENNQTSFKNKKTEIEIINDTIELNTYALNELGLTIKKIGSFIGCKEFESLRIYPNTNTFYWFSHQTGGGVIEFISTFHPEAKDSKIKAIEIAKKYIVDNNLSRLLKYNPNYQSKETINTFKTKNEYIDYLIKYSNYKDIKPEIPLKANTNKNIIDYLIEERKIAFNVVSKWIEKELIYEDIKGNLIFVGKDFNNEIKYTQIKSFKIKNAKNFVYDTKGSSKTVSVSMYNKEAKNLYITEAVIDAMSIQSMIDVSDDDIFLSINGALNHNAVNFFLSTRDLSKLKNIYICLDNDEAGILGAKKIKELLDKKNNYYTLDLNKINIEIITPKHKDFNDDLKIQYENNLKENELEM